MLKCKSILHPTDFSEYSRPAFEVACSLARDNKAELHLAHVIPPIVVGYGHGVVPPDPDVRRREVEQMLESLKAEAAPLSVTIHVEDGEAAPAVLSLADRIHCDLIVLGTHGRTGLARLLMGSIAEAIVRKAKCPVLTVKIPDKR
ncbi:MAG: universal stress protein UspA [Gemmatales bacterium]|nr:MAG: universal stress protein UspA [Gemmatales bacterium]